MQHRCPQKRLHQDASDTASGRDLDRHFLYCSYIVLILITYCSYILHIRNVYEIYKNDIRKPLFEIIKKYGNNVTSN